jgi:hypothetical protein
MSSFRDVIAAMAVDPEFARHARANPDAVARQFGLSTDEADRLRELADAAAAQGPAALGARLSKSGIGTGGLAGLVEGPDGELTLQAPQPDVITPIDLPLDALANADLDLDLGPIVFPHGEAGSGPATQSNDQPR